MGRDTIRAALALDPGAEPEQVLRELEERSGHPPERPMWLRGARVLALCLREGELELARGLHGVRELRQERPIEPPRPVRPRQEER